MANKLIFKDSEAARNAIMASQKKEIAALYENWADEIGERTKFYSHKSNASAPVSERYYRELQKQLRQTSQEVSNEIYKKIKSNIYTVADAVVSDNVKWLESFGFSSDGLNAAFSYVPHEIVQNLVTGQIYDNGWSLSSRIWGDNEQTLKDIYQVMAKGLAENKPIYQIAKDLEKYVRPSAQLPWNLRAADGVKIYKKQVDYNAQRLARTLVQHGYQQSFIATTQKNPFITEYIWRSNGSRVCDLCKARDGVHYKKTELPMDHPNGMCTMEPVVADDMTDQLADWFNSPDGTYPEIDAFAGNFGYQASKTGTVQDFIAKYGMSSKSPSSWFNSLTQIQKAEAKALKEQSGLTWNEWYEKHIYDGKGTSKYWKEKTQITSVNTAKKATATTKVAKTSGSISDTTSWFSKIKSQHESHMLDLERESMKLIGEAGKKGITIYSGSSYEFMNSYLRYLQQGLSESDAIDRSGISPMKLKRVKDVIEGLNNVKLPEDLVLRRGTDLGDLAGLFMQGDFVANKRSLYGKSVDELNQMFASAVGQYGSFTSTSSIWDKGSEDEVEVIIYAPKGTSASSIMSISRFGTHEGETLLNAGTTVRCIKVEKSDGHKGSDIRVFLEVITK